MACWEQLPRGTGSCWVFAGAAGAFAFTQHTPPSKCYFEERPDGSVDRLRKWSQSWNLPAGKNPGFHRQDVNPLLVKHLPRLFGSDPPTGLTVLVPLCGKSRDLIYLCHQGLDVVGVEGITRAISELKAEQLCHGLRGFGSSRVMSLGPTGWTGHSHFEPAEGFSGHRPGCVFKKGSKGLGYYSEVPRIWDGEVFSRHGSELVVRPLHIIEGDMFEVTPALVERATSLEAGLFDFVYDRGSMVAVPPASRRQYAAVLSDLVKPGGRILLITTDYDQSRVSGPPFSLSVAEVRQAFPSSTWMVEVLDEPLSDLPGTNPKFRGLQVTERVLLVTKRCQGEGNMSRLLSLAGLATAIVGAAFGLRLAS